MSFFQKDESGKVVTIGNPDMGEIVNAQYPAIDPEEMEEPETEGGESMEYITEPAEDTAVAATPTPAPAAKRRRGVSRMLVEAVSANPGLTQSEYQRALGIKSPIATMAKRLVERGVLVAKQDGRYVRYYPGKREFSAAQVGRKPKTATKEQQSRQPEQFAPSGWNIVSITYENGSTEQYVRLDNKWYELTPVDKPQF